MQWSTLEPIRKTLSPNRSPRRRGEGRRFSDRFFIWFSLGIVATTPWATLADGPRDRQASLAQATPPEDRGAGKTQSNRETASLSEKNATAGRNSTSQGRNEALLSRSESEAILEFVGQHQPKLLQLLTFLKRKQPEEYQMALREMGRSKQRLENLAQRDQELYSIELELWQTRSRLRLLAAELSVASEEKKAKLEQQLAALVKQELTQNLARLKVQRQRTIKQLEQLDNLIQTRSENQDEQIAKALKVWQVRIAKQSPRKKKNKSNN